MSVDSDSSDSRKFVGSSTLSARISNKERVISPRQICSCFLSEFFYLIELITGVAFYRCGFYKFHEGCYGRCLAFLMRLENNEQPDNYVALNIWPLLWTLPTCLLNYYVESVGSWDLISFSQNIVLLLYTYTLCLSIFSFLLAALQKLLEKLIVQQKFPRSALQKRVKKIKKKLLKKCYSKTQSKSGTTVQYSPLPSNGVDEPDEEVFTKKMVETYISPPDNNMNLPSTSETELPIKE